MKHATEEDIKGYVLRELPMQKDIRIGIHLDECRTCFLKAQELHSSAARLDRSLDSLALLPSILHKLEEAKQMFPQPLDKYSILTLLKGHRSAASSSTGKIIRGIIGQLNDPSVQITPLVSPSFDSIPLIGKKITTNKIDDNQIEYRIESAADEVPSLLSHSQDGKIEITAFKKKKGTKYYSAVVPHSTDKWHYLVHKTEKSKKGKRS